jgi:UDP-N-acetylglucosamine transferase subunit ALG13
VIAAARLEKYGEHQDDHQEQLVRKLAQLGSAIMMGEGDFGRLGELIERARGFAPVPVKSARDDIAGAVAAFIDGH